MSGKEFAVGDYVFLKPRSSQESFYIGRLLEIKSDQVHVNWFYRSRDLNGRGDSRELIASMDCDWNSLSSVEAKVFVKHQSQINDLKQFKIQDSCFYYDKLYDKYTKKTYQVVPLNQINNLPMQYKNLIKSEFLLIEEKSQKKFTQRRNCAACETWVNPTESNVVCSNCRRGFHLGCVGLKKELPKKGYGWVCGLCTKVKQDDSCSDLTEFSDLSEEEEEEIIVHHSNFGNQSKWPWRYFGDYSRLEDLFNDPEGRPKAGSRIGRNFQAVDLPVPGMSEISGIEKDSLGDTINAEKENNPIILLNSQKEIQVLKARGRGRPRKSETKQIIVKDESGMPVVQGVRKKDKKTIEEHELKIPERGENETLFSPKNISANELTDYINRVNSHFKLNSNAELICLSLSFLHKFKYNSDDAFKELSVRNLIDLMQDEWASDDIKLFENCFLEYGMDLSQYKESIPHKNMKEIVSFFYKWKNTPRFISLFNLYTAKSRSKRKSDDGKVVMALCDLNSDASSESETESMVDLPSEGVQCGFCKGSRSKRWRIKHVPKLVFLCSECELYWMKYGTQRDIETLKKFETESVKQEQIVLNQEVNLIPAKRKLLEIESTHSKTQNQELEQDEQIDLAVENSIRKVDEETEEEFKTRPCGVCSESLSIDSENPFLCCVDCKLKVHRFCYGVSPNDDDFRCDRCINIKTPELSLNYSCVLCPASAPSKLSALKKTIGNNWVHLICAIWIPEVKFGDTCLMNPVECIGHIDPNKWQMKKCAICNSSEGVTIQCCERNCSTYLHASCSFFAAEYVTMIGPKRASDLAFEPILFCMAHSRKWKNKSPSEESQSQLLTQYVRNNKGVGFELHTTGEKRAYSSLLYDSCECHISSPLKIPKNPKINHVLLQSAVENRVPKSCFSCSSVLSPFWWTVKPTLDADGHLEESQKPIFQCQRCKWEKYQRNINR